MQVGENFNTGHNKFLHFENIFFQKLTKKATV